ncbi:Protein of unknown function (DUF3638) [Candidatus Rhabdochlamydia oedothoracis]|uniref:DUF3638 domain-containing protein n=1 Tax=Candidatus Rhabdochlamydia oedothoracis TaxID=2720720 RepID=A0ABX8V2D0_9BACT|nr:MULTISPECIES: DUF3638 domain-containing protein [Rhabdochlamydia]KAG6559680.1 hypothetical protein RHOW815_000313 [Candidatus Rhabdochlamydia sp. W815]QYF49301.1 Protein of unknown function (DUF3638) [Candidatus Rhabdochlamydia oedothoracis]
MTVRLNINSNLNNNCIENSLNTKTDSSSLIEELIARVDAHQDREGLKNISKKLFAHIHLDHAIKGTLLEGGSLAENAKYLRSCLDVLDIPNYTKELICRALDSLVSCISAKETERKVRELPPGESLLVDGGYQDLSGGHAVLYEFYKKTDNTYDIYLYNTGEGIQYHPRVQRNGISFYQAAIKFEGVLPEELDLSPQNSRQDSSFFQYLAKLQNLDDLEEKNITSLYEKGFGHLVHKLVLAKEDFSPFIKGQYSGTCSWRVLQAFVLQTFCDSILYKKYIFELKLLTLALFLKKCEERPDLESCILIKEATTNLLRAAAKLYDEHSQEKTAGVCNALKEVLDRLEHLANSKAFKPKQEYKNERLYEYKLYSFVAMRPSAKALLSSINSESPKLFSSIEPSGFLPNSTIVLNHIPLLLDRDSKIFQIENFVRALPIPNPDPKNDIWQNLPQEDLYNSLSSIQTLIELYGDLCLSNPPCFPNQQNTALSLFAIAYCLALRIDQQQLAKLADYGIWNAFFGQEQRFFFDQNFFICFEPREQQRRQEIVTYFAATNKVKQQLFDFLKVHDSCIKGDLPETELFKQLIQQNPDLQDQLRERAITLQAKYRKISLKLAEESVLLTDNAWLAECNETQHVAFLRNISYIAQQFSCRGVICKGKISTVKFKSYQCEISLKITGSIKCCFPCWQAKGIDDWKSDPTIYFHLLTSKDQIQNLVKELDIFSQHAESELRLQKEHPYYRKQLETTKCEPSLQPQKLLYYFQEHIEELTDLNKQVLFDILFFKQVGDEVPLFQEVQTKSLFIEQCTQFIVKGLKQFSKESSEEPDHFFAYLFFVRLLYRMNQVCQELQLPIIKLPSSQDQVNGWLESVKLSVEDRACLHLHRMMQYAYLPNASMQQLEEIIPSWFFYNRSHVLERRLPYFENQANIFIRRIVHCIEKLKPEQIKQIMSKVLQTLEIANISEDTDLQSFGKFPVYTIECLEGKTWTLNLLTTQIANGSSLIESASTKELLSKQKYQDLFGDKAFTIHKLEGYYHFSCPEKGGIRIQIFEDKNDETSWVSTSTSDCSIERNIDGNWYQYIPKTDLIKTKLPRVLVRDHLHWHSAERSEMLIFNADNQLTAKVSTENASSEGSASGKFVLLQIESMQQERILCPEDPLEGCLVSLSKIESRDECLIFRDENEKYTRVHVPRLRSLQKKELCFTFDKSGQKAHLEGEKGFTIAQHIPKLVGCIENYLILEDTKRDKQKVLIPVQQIEQSKKFFSEKICLDLLKEEKNIIYLEFELNERHISAINVEGTLLLTYLYLAQKEYVKAVQYLHQIRRADLLSEISSAILYNCLLIADGHPSACAIYFKALFLLRSTDKEKTIKEDLFLYKKLIENFHSYKQRVSNVDSTVKLSDEEKAYCFNFFTDQCPIGSLLQTWKAGFFVHPDLPLTEWKEKALLSDTNFLNWSIACFFEWLCNYRTQCADLYKKFYQLARANKCRKEKLRISTRLHFTSIDLSNQKDQFYQIMHFALKYPELAPDLDSLELQQLLKNYIKKYEKEQCNPKPAFQTSAEESVFKYKHLKPLQLFLSSSQIKIEESLVLSNIELKDRCLNLSHLAARYFDQLNTTQYIGGHSLEVVLGKEKEQYKQAIEQQYKDFRADLEAGALLNQGIKEFRLKKSEIENLFTALQEFRHPDLLRSQEQSILELANTKPKETVLYNTLLETSRFKAPVHLKQLICAFLRGDANEYSVLNPYLSVQEIQKLDCLLQRFMLESTKQCQVERALILLENLQKTEESASIEQELYTVLTEEMSYDPGQSRVLLVYEYQAKIRVRQNQAKLIFEMTAISETGECKNLITQLIMGGGKTSVLASILLVILAKPNRLAVFVPPATQFDTLRNNLKTTQHTYFFQELIPIDATRSDFCSSKLQEVYQNLVEVQKKRWAVLIKKETIQSFALELQSSLYKAQDLEKIHILRDIVKIFRSSGHAIFDECDLQLNPMQEVNFTLGEKKQIDPMYIECAVKIFELLVSQHKIVNQSQTIADFVGLLQNAQSFMKTEDYYEQVLPVIAEELFTSCKSLLLLSEENRLSFLHYVQGKINSSNQTTEESRFLTLLREYASSAESVERDAAALIAWIKAQCTEILPLTLTKDTNRHYGRSNTQDLGKVVPYKGVNSPSTTQFGNPWEALAYQFQTALSQKLSVDLVRPYAEKAYQGAQANELYTGTPFEQTQEAIKFFTIAAVSLTDIKDKNRLDRAVENINSNPNKILQVEAELVASLISYHSSYLNSNASHLVAQFASVTGFSGTPWNSSCYPKDLAENILLDAGTEGRIVDVAYQKAEKNPQVIHVIQNTEVQKILKVCLENNPRKDQVTAFIDVAGLFKDYDNLYTAKQILKYFEEGSRIECVLFFGRPSAQAGSSNTLMALKRGNLVPIVIGSTRVEDLKKQNIDPRSTFIYYDECHCEATDLPQIQNAVNLLSSDASIILRDLLQGMLRARGFLKGQDIEYVIHENTIKQLNVQDKPTFENAILNPSLINQAERKAKETYRTFLHEIDHVLCKSAWDQILDTSDPDEMIAYFKKYQMLFLHNSEIDPFKQYGNLLQKEVTQQALENYKQQRLQYWKQIQPDIHLQNVVAGELTQVIQRASNCKFLPDSIEITLSELGKEQEVELEQETELEVDTEVETELEAYQCKDIDEPRPESTWEFDAIALNGFLQITKNLPKKGFRRCLQERIRFRITDFITKQNPSFETYREIFEEQEIFMTRNAAIEINQDTVFTNEDQVVVIKEQARTYAIILSVKEASAFKEYLANHPDNIRWVVLNNNKIPVLFQGKDFLSALQEPLVHTDWLEKVIAFFNDFCNKNSSKIPMSLFVGLDEKQTNKSITLGMPNTYRLSDFIQSYPHHRPYYQVFEEQEILITENAVFTSYSLNSVFSHTQKPAHQVAIVKEQGKMHAIILSIKEARTFKEYLAATSRENMWLILPNGDKLSPALKDGSPLNIRQELLEDTDWVEKTLWFINFFNGDMSYLAEHTDLTKRLITEKNTELKTRFLNLKTIRDPKQKVIFCYLLQHVLEESSKDNRLKSQQHLLDKRKRREKVEHLTNQEISALSIGDKEYIPFLSAEKICYLQEPDLIQCLDPAQIQAVTANQVRHLLDSQIRFLTTPEQIQQVHQRQLGSLLPQQLCHLALSQIRNLPDEKIQYLEKRLLQKIDGQRICQLYQAKNILPSQLKELSKAQLKALLQENDIREILLHLDNEQLKYI